VVFFGFRWEKMKIKILVLVFLSSLAIASVALRIACMCLGSLPITRRPRFFLIRPNRTGQSEPAVGGDACGGEQYAMVGMAL
jgi:hypothetical protein